MIQDDLVEVPPTGLPPDVFLDDVSSQLVQVDGVGERFAGNISNDKTQLAQHRPLTWWTGC